MRGGVRDDVAHQRLGLLFARPGFGRTHRSIASAQAARFLVERDGRQKRIGRDADRAALQAQLQFGRVGGIVPPFRLRVCR